MTIRFNPPSDDALEAGEVLPAGEYDFDVTWAEEKTSSNGNDMIALRLQIFPNSAQEPVSVFDYLTFSKHPMPMRKIRDFCLATGLEDAWNNGSLSADACRGRAAKVTLKVSKDRPAPDGGVYPPKNEVVAYKVAAKSNQAFGGADPEDDDIPF